MVGTPVAAVFLDTAVRHPYWHFGPYTAPWVAAASGIAATGRDTGAEVYAIALGAAAADAAGRLGSDRLRTVLHSREGEPTKAE